MATKAIVGEKLGMTQVWRDDKVVPVTVLKVTPCRIVQIKHPETDGYSAVQVAMGTQKEHRLIKPELGAYEKAGVAPGKKLVELRLDDVSAFEVGQEITAEILEDGEIVDVTAVSKGQGFTGVMKRHNFKGQRASHGAHRVHRMPGAVGQCATPARIFKGKKMAGRSGAQKVTTQNLQIVESNAEENIVLIRGNVPGPKGGTVLVRNAVKGTN
ncbi:MAG: 50S ribosomal protein L3 [Acidimicrobiales bacterium]|nr:50S ribosomal protein L3 [Acidimicrobiales bacterium]RZV46904.1 MAG: 50S ribosomal protein L3 [Acidimicrobiales bacterium]